jgi:diadenylate cyclase
MSELVAAFGWRDAVDVLIVSVVVYRVLVMFRGTRSVQILVGLAVFVVASLLARQLELTSVQWLLDSIWSFWAVALVVLFQPELRRALGRIGEGRMFRNLTAVGLEERTQVVDELVRVAHALAARRVGALMVIERTGGLRNYAELGVRLDAIVSADLLESVFVPPSPLHDGAALIQGDRVVAAGCFLPLSRNLELGRALGTRHRAALGISEETDAVALVVSEETGRVSLAVEGRMDVVPDAETLRRRLTALIEAGPALRRALPFWRGVRRLLVRRPRSRLRDVA